MKKLLSLTLVVIMLFSCMTGCKNEPTSSDTGDEGFTSDLGIVIMDGDEVSGDSNNTDGNDTDGNNTDGNKTDGNNTDGNDRPSSTIKVPTTIDHGDKKGYYLNDLNNTGKKATLKNNCYSTGYPVAKKTVTFNVMIKNYGHGENFETIKINDFFLDKMNVKINWIPVTQNNMADRVVLACTSGNMPDMFWGIEPLAYSTVLDYGKQGLFLDFNKYKDYMPNINRMFKEDPVTKYVVSYEDGGMYSLPVYFPDHTNNIYEGLYINKTWLKKLNLSMPSNTSQFMKVLTAFKNNDPNGNGKADEIPLCLSSSNMAGILPGCLYGPFGLPVYGGFAGYSINDSGKVIANYITDNYKTALTYYSTLYKRGLINSDWTTNYEDGLKKKLNTSTVTVGAFVSNVPHSLMDAKRFNDNYAIVPAFRDKSVSKATWAISEVEALWKGWAMVSGKCEYPEVAVRVLDYLYSLEGTLTAELGPQGYNWDVKSDGSIYMTEDYYKGTHKTTELCANYATPHYPTKTYNELIDKTRRSDLMTESAKISSQVRKDIVNTYTKVKPKYVMPNIFAYTTDKSDSKKVSSELTSYVQRTTTEFITGKTDINSFWDNYVSVCKSLGVDNDVYYKQIAYDRYMKVAKELEG